MEERKNNDEHKFLNEKNVIIALKVAKRVKAISDFRQEQRLKQRAERIRSNKGENFALEGDKVIAIEDVDETFMERISKGTVLTVRGYREFDDTYEFEEIERKHIPYTEGIGPQTYFSKSFKKYEDEKSSDE